MNNIMMLAIAYLAVINFVAVILTLHDKRTAAKSKWRVSEKTLLLAPAIGGAVGMFVTMRLIRHKTKHPKFMIGIPVLIAVQIAITVPVSLYTALHSTHYKYNNWWIVGRSTEEVETRYGEFDIRVGNRVGYYLYTGNRVPIMSDSTPCYYYMEFDENNIVRQVYKCVQPGG